MKLRRGAALPGAIILGSFMVLIAMGLAIVLLDISGLNKVSRAYDSNEIVFAQGYKIFTEDGSLPNEIEYYTWKIYEKDEDVKALTANYKSGNGIAFLAVYDFDQDKTLAYQVGNIYTTNKGGVTYLADIVPMVN